MIDFSSDQIERSCSAMKPHCVNNGIYFTKKIQPMLQIIYIYIGLNYVSEYQWMRTQWDEKKELIEKANLQDSKDQIKKVEWVRIIELQRIISFSLLIIEEYN